MILIADSGSTSTDWRCLLPNPQGSPTIQQARTAGLNPYFYTEETLPAQIRQELLPQISGTVSQIYFYGSGCGAAAAIEKMEKALLSVFPGSQVHVHDDMLGAARALCGHSNGIACILGTGSNSCLFLDGKIAQKTPSNGIWFGDEGSAGHLGKQLIGAYLNETLPTELRTRFEKRFPERRAEILDKVYSQPFPNRYLASFSRFILQNIDNIYLYQLVYESFLRFLENTVCRYPDYQNYPVHFTGSVAFYFVNILRKAAVEKQVYIKNVLESPIAGLSLFHLEAEKE